MTIFENNLAYYFSVETFAGTNELWASKFNLGQNEDYSPGGSISDSSEKMLQRGKGEGQYIRDFGQGGRVHAIKHTFFAEGCC